ncbi:hypothetical protein PRUPE_3G079200 [Prunus persica]|uniref:Protein kinase domain-containing protein n=1 Tax=Prunus persica TaxID=3760 RepID=A0A251PYB3_PRUPE|nr:hypothetical protein PRUPE_3G079200 [Prunus persica]
MRVHHTNLVSLIGYCDEVANGNLQHHIFSADITKKVLTWKERLQIVIHPQANKITRLLIFSGLDYPHTGCKLPIVHRDLKTSNILDYLHTA